MAALGTISAPFPHDVLTMAPLFLRARSQSAQHAESQAVQVALEEIRITWLHDYEGLKRITANKILTGTGTLGGVPIIARAAPETLSEYDEHSLNMQDNGLRVPAKTVSPMLVSLDRFAEAHLGRCLRDDLAVELALIRKRQDVCLPDGAESFEWRPFNNS